MYIKEKNLFLDTDMGSNLYLIIYIVVLWSTRMDINS